MNKIEEIIRKDLDLYYNNHSQYKEKVDAISNLLNLKGESKLADDYLPIYVVGDYKNQKEKYVIVSLNPGLDKKGSTKIEEEQRRGNGTFEDYQIFNLNYFEKIKGFKYKFYSDFDYYLEVLLNEKITQTNRNDIWQEHIICMDIIPYHSHKLELKYSKDATEYIRDRMNTILEMIEDIPNVKGVIFNGSPLRKVIMNAYPDINIKPNSHDICLFSLNGVKCVQHKFLNAVGRPTTIDERVKIAKEFLEYVNL